jgi:phage tail-like protein
MRKGFPPSRVAEGASAPTYTDHGAVTIGSLLPAVYQEFDENSLRFTAALDQVVAPVWLSIDCFDSYLDPAITPDDVAAWLAGWVGVIVDDNWYPEQLRRLAANAFELYRWRGTAKGIADLVEAYTGLRPTVEDGGGISASSAAGTATIGPPNPTVSIRFETGGLSGDDLERLVRLVQSAVPIHIQARIDIS